MDRVVVKYRDGAIDTFENVEQVVAQEPGVFVLVNGNGHLALIPIMNCLSLSYPSRDTQLRVTG